LWWVNHCQERSPQVGRFPHGCGTGGEAGAGRRLAEPGQSLCLACRAEPLHVDCARSLARYEDSLVRAMVLLKFEEMDPLAD